MNVTIGAASVPVYAELLRGACRAACVQYEQDPSLVRLVLELAPRFRYVPEYTGDTWILPGAIPLLASRIRGLIGLDCEDLTAIFSPIYLAALPGENDVLACVGWGADGPEGHAYAKLSPGRIIDPSVAFGMKRPPSHWYHTGQHTRLGIRS